MGFLIYPISEALNPAVNVIAKKTSNGVNRPLPARCEPKVIHNSGKVLRLSKESKCLLKDLCPSLFDNQTFRRFFAALGEAACIGHELFAVAHRGHLTAPVTTLYHLLHFGARPLANHFRVHTIHQNCHLLIDVSCQILGETLTNKLNFYSHFGEEVFGDMVGFSTRKAAHVGDTDFVEEFCLSISQKRLPVGAFQIGSALSLVGVYFGKSSPVLNDMTGIDLPLSVNGGEVTVRLVVTTTAQINRIAPLSL